MKDDFYRMHGYDVYTYDRIDSTNEVSKRAIDAMGIEMHNSAHVTGEQTAGKGRQGRTWLNTEGAVMMSIVKNTRMSVKRIPIISLAAAATVMNVLTRMTKDKLDISIKWPNDIVTTDRMEKICGILSEMIVCDDKKYVIVGIGVNLNALTMPEGLLQPATSVYRCTGIRLRIMDVVSEIIKEFDVQYELLTKDPEGFLDCFSKNCISLNRHVAVSDAKGTRYGKSEKLTGEGSLVVQFEDGKKEVVMAADVSIRNQESITESLALKIRPKRRADSNKGSHGRALIIAGSENMPGAALMCTKACIRAGAGLTKVLVPKSLTPSFAVVPEAMLCNDDAEIDKLIEWASVILIGCGMGVNDRTKYLLEKALKSKKTCIVDADALNTMSANRELLKLLHDNTVITPHPAEFARLCACDTEEVLRGSTLKSMEFASEYGCFVLLKSSVSVIAAPDGRIRYNDSGNSALAKGGSGDVLAGLITGFAAQGAKPFNAASLGAYTLGISAEKALEFLNNRFVAATDIVDMIAADAGETRKLPGNVSGAGSEAPAADLKASEKEAAENDTRCEAEPEEPKNTDGTAKAAGSALKDSLPEPEEQQDSQETAKAAETDVKASLPEPEPKKQEDPVKTSETPKAVLKASKPEAEPEKQKDPEETSDPFDDIPERKAKLRKQLRAKRRAVSPEERASAAIAVAKKLCSLERIRAAKYVLAYMPMKSEFDIQPAVYMIEAKGVTVVYPLCIDNGGLRLFVPAEENGFVKGAYGILEPNTETAREISPDELDAIILPAVGFDRKGRRLGQGGGYYDRLLASVSCFTVAVGYDCQLVDEVPTEKTDRSVDAVVTPSVLLEF